MENFNSNMNTSAILNNSAVSNIEKFPAYSEILKNTFEKIKKNITKKNSNYNELTAICRDINEKIAGDKGKELSADKYFIYIKMAMEGDNIKLIEGLLENLQKLVKEDFLLGLMDDINLLSENRRENEMEFQGFHFKLKRKLIDTIVDTIIKLFSISDENIWLNSVKLLYSMYKNPRIKIHNESILKIFKFCIRIYLSSRTNINIDTTKSCLNQIIMLLFNKMEACNSILMMRENSIKFDFEEKESIFYTNVHTNTNMNMNNYSITMNNMSMTTITGKDSNSNLNFLNKPSNSRGICSDISSQLNAPNSLIGLKTYSFLPMYRNPVNELLSKIAKKLVDDVCLFAAKKECVNTKEDLEYLNIIQIPRKNDDINLSNEDNGTSVRKFYANIYRKLSNPLIENERGYVSGNFGWCYICRQRADLYCKETRLPICSLECKKKLQEEDEKLKKYMNGDLLTEDDLALLYMNDALSVFKSLCKLVNTSLSHSNEHFNSKAKTLALELILSIFEKPGQLFLTGREFAKIVRDDLIDGLLRNCTSEDVNLFSLSLNVFFKIWNHFREYLKSQISVFIETVCLKILDSGNSSFNHKWCVLDNFFKLVGTPRYLIELYVNYDCDINEKDLLNRLVIAMSKISQGKYTKSDHLLTPQQDFMLRSKSLEILTLMVRGIFTFTQEQLGVNFIRNYDETPKDDINLTVNGDADFYQDDTFSMFETVQNDMKEKLDMNRKIKSDINTAVEKFNIKIKNGLLYLKKTGLINSKDKEQEAKDLSYFLKNSHGLKKENIGDFLGENNELALKTLHYFTQSFDFKNLNFVDALRLYLSTFQLPGEGQKVDRITEKFAAKFCLDNPDLFESADSAYYLAYSTIMLQTSLHNVKIKDKMKLKDFCNLLKGLNGGKDLSQDFLAEIYNKIQEKAITLVEHEEAKDKLEGGLAKDAKKKQDLFKKETERMFQEGTERLKQGKGVNKQYLKVTDAENVAPLMDSIWTALLALYSLMLDDTDDDMLNELSVEGITHCIRLCGMLNLDLQKEALIKGFCKLTNLLQGKEIKEKNIMCIRSLLQLANTEGRFLKGCWKNLLELISKIDYYHMVTSGSKLELENFFNEIKQKKRGSIMVDKEIQLEKNNMDRIGKEISPDDYEIIFNKTVLLDESSIVDFIKSLCEISREELANKDYPRIFSLQKLVEVAEFNMSRVRLVWAKIWNIISEHLTEVGSNSSPVIAEKAVDSLRQLAKKFLQKDEISVYQFQKEFLKPFENILINNINVYKTKEYVLTCITNLVLAEAPNIKSGWRIIFNIFQLAAEDSSIDIIRKTFETLTKIFKNHFTQVKDNFPELAYCLKKFSKNFPEEVINLFYTSFDLLEETQNIFALLSSLASILSDSRANIRKIATTGLFNLLNKIAEDKNLKSTNYLKESPEEELWTKIFHVILKPIFDDLMINKYSSTLYDVFYQTADIFERHYAKVGNLLKDFLNEVSFAICSETESTALVGNEALKYLLQKESLLNHENFWDEIIFTISEIFHKTIQVELLQLKFDIKNFDNQEYHTKYNEIVYKNIIYCIVQHNLIELSEYIIETRISFLHMNQIQTILDCLKESFELAYDFNIEFNLRKLISQHFLSDLNQTAALFKQQQDGIELYYKIMKKVYESISYNNKAEFRNKILFISHKLLKQFIDRINYSLSNENDEYLISENERLVNNMVPVIIDCILPSLNNVKFYEEPEVLNDFTEVFIDIIPCGIVDIRVKIKEILKICFDKIKDNTENKQK